MVQNLLKSIVLIFASTLLLCIVLQYNKLPNIHTNSPVYWLIISYVALYVFLLRKHLSFLETFIHELSHLIVALLAFKKINTMHVSRDSGLIQYEGKQNFLITLAPYIFPFTPILIILISLIISDSYLYYAQIVFIISFLSYLLRVLFSSSPKQTDLRESGLLFSYALIIELNLIYIVFTAFYLNDSTADFFKLFSLKTIQTLLL